MMRATTPSTYILASQSETLPFGTPPLLPILLPTPSPPLLLPSTEHRANSSSALIARPDGDFKRDYGFIATLDDEIMRDPERDVGYGITDTWDEMLVGMLGAPATDETELGRRVTDLVTIDVSRGLGTAMDASDLACTEVMALRTQVVAQRSKIAELRAADRRRQTQFTEALKLLKTLQTQLMALQSRQEPARGPAQPDAPEEAEEKHDMRNEMKARGTLVLMALPNKDQLKFHSYKDAKLLMEAIERVGGNKESKKVQEDLLKQQYENLVGLILPQCRTNEADNTTYGVSSAHTQSNPISGDNLSDVVICAFLASQPNSPQFAQEDLEQIDHDDLEEMDLQ
ncbi:hypothetical protein Tco_0098941 [Tanacetum coccineum]